MIKVYDENSKRFVEIQTQRLRVGDVVKTQQNEFFPADVLLLKTSNKSGAAYVETANLDGETNLKIRKGLPVTYEISANLTGDDYPLKLAAVIQSALPSAKMDDDGWNGNMIGLSLKEDITGRAKDGDRQSYPLRFKQLCLRACQLRNTDWAIGIVIFTGNETKVMQNSQKTKFKRSNVDLIVDKMLYF